MATESMVTQATPHGPSEVRIIDVDRNNSDWGDLREQSADEVTESRREALNPQIRRQVEAYFRSLAERSLQLEKQK